MTDDFDKWCDQWAKAQADGVFKDTKPPTPSPQAGVDDFFGNHRPPAETTVSSPDAEYWRKVYQLSSHSGEYHDPLTQLNEDAPVAAKELAPVTKPDGKTAAQITDDLGKLPNPVAARFRGKDKNDHVTPDWAGGENLIELHKMKEELNKLEDRLAADPMLGDKKSSKILTQIESLHKRLDKLSNDLSPNFTTEYLS